ncbi:nose resistant to fluoxetine protein 6-like [Ptychodera flava]|uniref:nose resistant to fluoxetine protein 6-like n=1 Tax=Ptychodera flava TaxID=63121 RepID=UPI00396AA08A
MAVRNWMLCFAIAATLAGHRFTAALQGHDGIWKLKKEAEVQFSSMPSLDEIPDDDEMVSRLRDFLLATPSDARPTNKLSATCGNDTRRFADDFSNSESYARQMVVSFGIRIQTVREYPFTFDSKNWGLFEVCRDVKPTEERSFGGMYCLSSDLWGICFPDSCNSSEVAYILYEAGLAEPNNVYCVKDIPFRTGDYIAIAICSVVAGLMVLGTSYDVIWQWNLKRKIKRSEEIANMDTIKEELIKNKSTAEELKKRRPGVLGRILISFSVVTNGRKLLGTSSGNAGTISSINGIRVISMMWVILGHSYYFSLSVIGGYKYPLTEAITRFSYLGLSNGAFGVDTFFLLSGCLVSYLTLKQLHKTKGRLNWLLFYFHRWWRLTPAFGLMLLIWSTLMLYLGSGPVHDQYILGSQKVCQDYWWATIFYFNNLHPWPPTTSHCMGWVWYLCCDMQLFILSPFFIILLYKSPKVGTFTVGISTVISISIVAVLATYYGYAVPNDPTFYNDNLPPGGDYIYPTPWGHLQSYLVGIYLGYVLCRLDGRKVKINQWFNLIMWCVAIGSGLAVVYGQYPALQGNHPDQWVAALYKSVTSFAFVTAVAWVIFACATGNGGPVDSLLSWNAWSPLSRLTYCAYLVHPIVMYLYYWSRKTVINYTELNMIYYFVANLVLSYAVAFVVSLAIESPMIGLEKIIFRR